MKRTLIVLSFIAVSAVGCSYFRPFLRPLFPPKVDVHSSPEFLMTAYREYKIAGQAEKVWQLYSDNLKQQNPNGLLLLKDSLARNPVSEISIGNPVAFSDGRVLYYNIVIVRRGGSILERIGLAEEDGRWFIEQIGQEVGESAD